jgi:multidrug efflux pump
MRISDISISRPVFATVINLIILLIGVVCFTRLPIREYPKIDEPAVTVSTSYPGANAEIMEAQVTKIIEDSISGIEGIKYITSTSREGVSQISVRFNLNRDADDSAAEVRDRVSRVRGKLPDEIDEPVISKVEADADPIIWITMRSEELTQGELTDLADNIVKDKLQTLPGVSDVFIFGSRRYAMRIWLNPLKLAAFNITTSEVENALRQQNIDIPSGRIEGLQREFTVLSNTDINEKDDFKNVVIANRDGRFIKISDIAKVTLGVEDDRVAFRFNGKNAVGLGVVKQSVANPLDISKQIEKALPKVRDSLPTNVTIEVGYDSSKFIQKSIDNVYKTLLEALLFVSIVILLFLRSFRATIIPLVTIPVSLIGTFGIMFALGFTVNTLTLLAMVLAIGLVVDDAIVMMENIYRKIESGMKPIDAAFLGSREIGFAVLAMTITLAAVYFPVAFMEGRTGKLFIEFALTLASTVIISGFVALTLSPMMSSRLLRKESEQQQNKFFRKISEYLAKLDKNYKWFLTRFMSVRIFAIPILVVTFILIFVVSSFLKSELSPVEDRGSIFMVFIGPEGATVDYMSAYAEQLEEIIAKIPEVNRFGLASGIGSGRLPLASQGLSFWGLKPWEERTRKTQEIAASVAPLLFDVTGVLAFPIVPASLGGGFFAKPLEIVVKDSRSYEKMSENVDKLIAELSKNPSIIGIESDLKMNTPQLKVNINRDKLADLGISVSEAGRTLETLLATRQVTRYKQNGEQYDVKLAIEESEKLKPDQINNIHLRTKSGSLIPLSTVVEIKESVAPRDLNHFDRMRSVTITANLAPKYSLGEALTFVEAKAKEVLPKSAQIDYNGQSREFKESSSGLYLAFVLAILFIFLVLAAQFESYIDPLIIMVTVPLSMFGALLALFLTGNSLNIYSQIGLITLIGLITKHGILMVEFANHKQEEGYFLLDAIIEAASLRLRPILMTTAATILGALPLALASGAGSESRAQIGWVVVGGMLIGTLMTLFVVPAFYMFFNKGRKNIVKIPKTEAN